MDYEIAIPSYKRANILVEKTLKLLSSIPKENIKIFIRNEEELDNYIQICGNDYNYIITEASGIKNTRNYLRKYYKNKELDLVLFIDDDIEKLEEYVDKKTLKPVENLEEVLSLIYTETKKRNLSFFGVCGFNNPFFMSNKVSTNLKYIIGAFCGIIEPQKYPLIETSIDHGEDYEFSILHFLEDGGVCRFNMYCITTKYYNQVGGICEDMGGLKKRNENAKVNFNDLVSKYPRMCRIVKKCELYDLKLNFRFKKDNSGKYLEWIKEQQR